MATRVVNKLTDLRANFVSLVDNPAHPGAEVVISKRADVDPVEDVEKANPDAADVHVNRLQEVEVPKGRKKPRRQADVPPQGREDVGKAADEDTVVDDDAAGIAELDAALEVVEKQGRVYAQHRLDRLKQAHQLIGTLIAEGDTQVGATAEETTTAARDDVSKAAGVAMSDVKACKDPAHADMNAFDHLAAHLKAKAKGKVAKADRPMKTDGGEQYPAEAYAYVPDPESPSTWKLRLWESPSEKVTASQVGAAAAAFSPGGFRGNKVQIPPGDVAKVKARVRSAWKSANPDKPESEMPDSIAKGVVIKLHGVSGARVSIPGGGRRGAMVRVSIGGRAGAQHA
jgi:hypothetical protein